MLEKAEIEAKIPVGDVEAARRFYEGTLGFPVVHESPSMEGLKTDAKGIADFGTEKGAWFRDPDGNILTIWQAIE